jgi:MFS family permease
VRALPKAYLPEALGDLGAALGFGALSLEIARTGEAFWVGAFGALGYLTLGPLLLLSPWLDRVGPRRGLLALRLLRALLWLPLPLLPREAALLVLWAYPIMVATDLGVVAWDAYQVRFQRERLQRETGLLYAAWNLGGLLGWPLGPLLLLLHPALPYLGAAGVLLLALFLLTSALPHLPQEAHSPGPVPRASLRAGLRALLAHPPLRPYLLLSLLFQLGHALATALLGLLILRSGAPEALFGLLLALEDLGYALGGLLAGRLPPGLARPLPLALALAAGGFLLPFPLLLPALPLYGLGVGLLSARLRALRGERLPEEGLAAALAGLRALLYGAGALGGLGAGVFGRLDPALPVWGALLAFLLLFLLGRPRKM